MSMAIMKTRATTLASVIIFFMAVSFIVWGIVWGPWAFMAMRESIDHATLRHDVVKA
jgi:hypothetical protein